MARRLNPKPFGLGFKSPRKQFGNLFGEVHCSGDTVAHLTFTVARWLRWPALTRRYIEKKSPISHQNRRYIAINRRFLEIYPEKSSADISVRKIVSIPFDTRYFGDISPKYRDIFLLGYDSLIWEKKHE